MSRPYRCLIGIPTLNGPDRLARCLTAIRESTALDGSMLVLVADDGSRAEELAENKRIVAVHGIEMLTAPQRLGVAREWNRLARHTESDVIVLVNDDVEVVPDWLDVLTYSVLENVEAGIVSLNAIVGMTKADAPLGAPSGRVDYHEARLMDGGGSLVSAGGACFALRRDVYDAVGGYDERFLCFYEEIDFCVSARRRGYRSLIASYPLVYHAGGATTSDPRNMDASRDLAASRQKFLEKWGATPGDIRRDLLRRTPASGLREWNSQLRFLET